jgi:hypothetical protein
MSHWHAEVWIRIWDILLVLPLSFILCGESRLLISLCATGRCGIASSNEDHGRSRRHGAKDHRWSHMADTRWLSDREVGWHRVWSAPCMWRREARVPLLSFKTMVDGSSVVWPQNHWDGLTSKPVAHFSLVWPQNWWQWFLLVWPQNWWLGFFDLCLKTGSYSLMI